MYCIEESTCDIVGTLRRQGIAPPLCSPHYTPAVYSLFGGCADEKSPTRGFKKLWITRTAISAVNETMKPTSVFRTENKTSLES